MQKGFRVGLCLGILALVGTSARAESFTFNFNSLASGANAASIQSYMNGVLGGAATVAVSSGAVTDRTYNGDGHVVGPCSPASCGSGATVSSVTLGTDTFVRNKSGVSSFTFTFTGLFIESVSFDYEIFPDGTCTALTTRDCGGSGFPNLPDMTFSTNLGEVFHYYAAAPSSPGYTHSPASGRSSTEKAPQLIGSGSWNLGSGVTTLIFQDWPATIAIDNLVITTSPEPGAIVLLGSLMAVFLWQLKRKKQTA